MHNSQWLYWIQCMHSYYKIKMFTEKSVANNYIKYENKI